MEDPLIGKVVGKSYKILEYIGEGGFGVVYKVLHIRLETVFALKLLFPREVSDFTMIKRFEREAKTTSKIGHPNIVFITDFGFEKDVGYYFVMEFLEGETLKERLKRRGAMSPVDALHIGIQIASALSATHKLGIIHRDLKPANIFLVNKGEYRDFVKILDFGVAGLMDQMAIGEKLSTGGILIGTPSYVSPEQIKGKSIDHRTDIYSFGIILYEIITGDVPFKGTNSYSIMKKHVSEKPISPSKLKSDLKIPVQFENIILKSIAKRPSQRFQSAEEMLIEMQNLREEMLKKAGENFQDKAVHLKEKETPTIEDFKVKKENIIKNFLKKRLWLFISPILLSIAVFFVVVVIFKQEREKKDIEYLYENKKDTLEGTQEDKIEEKTIRIKKKFEMKLQVNSHPQHAYVFSEDGVLIGITPLNLTLKEKDKTFFLTIKFNGYKDEKILISSQEIIKNNIAHIEVFLEKEEKKKEKKEEKREKEKKPSESPFEEL